jgi:hypothetical protein
VRLFAATPLPAVPKGDEPIAVPRTIKQGIDFVYVDPQMSSVARRKQRPQNWLARLFNFNSNSQRAGPNPLFIQLGTGPCSNISRPGAACRRRRSPPARH